MNNAERTTENQAQSRRVRRNERVRSGFAWFGAFCATVIFVVAPLYLFTFGALCGPTERTARMEISQLHQMVQTYYLITTPNRLPDTLEELTEGPHPLTERIPKDPWGREYIYIRYNDRKFEILSGGPDGVIGIDGWRDGQ